MEGSGVVSAGCVVHVLSVTTKHSKDGRYGF